MTLTALVAALSAYTFLKWQKFDNALFIALIMGLNVHAPSWFFGLLAISFLMMYFSDPWIVVMSFSFLIMALTADAIFNTWDTTLKSKLLASCGVTIGVVTLLVGYFILL